MKQDLRNIKTRNAIENAFINLVEMKGFCKISIIEIAEKAQVNRNTIYINYGSKEGILSAIITESFKKRFGTLKLENIKDFRINKKKIEDIFRNIFNIIDENIELYRTLLTDTASLGYLKSEIERTKKNIKTFLKPTVENEMRFSFFLAGVWGVIDAYIIYAKGSEEENIKILTDLTVLNLKHMSYSK